MSLNTQRDSFDEKDWDFTISSPDGGEIKLNPIVPDEVELASEESSEKIVEEEEEEEVNEVHFEMIGTTPVDVLEE